jgi:putative colanic acid biosynthesis glycosyltransferase
MVILQINSVVNSGSTGRIAEDIGNMLIAKVHTSYIAYGRGRSNSASRVIKIGRTWDVLVHGFKSGLFDRHGFASVNATHKFIQEIGRINPDVIHLHNIHGYYLNINLLFNFLKISHIPVVWTFHDCWPFTGHCSYFERVNCYKWQTHCEKCPNKHGYPQSYWLDNSKDNFFKKRELFNGLQHMQIVTPSSWLAEQTRKSFLGSYPVNIIPNGVDLETFKPMDDTGVRAKYRLNGQHIVLGVANIWKKRKGLEDFAKLSSMLDKDHKIVLVGVTDEQKNALPENVTGIQRTEDLHDLACLYSAASVFVNPTYADNFPTTNLEALACGTPVITYNTGGSPEAVDENTGLVVDKGDIANLSKGISRISAAGKTTYRINCRKRAVELYDKNRSIEQYAAIYENLIRRDQ